MKDTILKATAGALQPKGLDLAQLRQRSGMETIRPLRIRPEEAAGAMGMMAQDWLDSTDTVIAGNPMAAVMMRIKYANLRSPDTFATGAEKLLERRYSNPPSLMNAIALVSIFEWCYDACTRCRSRHPRAIQPTYCTDCGQRKAKDEDGRDLGYLLGQPSAGCPKCAGSGRIFSDDKQSRRPRGMVCVSCNNTGRRYFKGDQRWRLVNDVQPIEKETFKTRWQGKYIQLLRDLRAIDKNIAKGIDIQLRRSQNVAIEPFPVEEPEADESGGGPQIRVAAA